MLARTLYQESWYSWGGLTQYLNPPPQYLAERQCWSAEEFQVTVSHCRVQDISMFLEEVDRGLDQAAERSLDPASDLVMGLRQRKSSSENRSHCHDCFYSCAIPVLPHYVIKYNYIRLASGDRRRTRPPRDSAPLRRASTRSAIHQVPPQLLPPPVHYQQQCSDARDGCESAVPLTWCPIGCQMAAESNVVVASDTWAPRVSKADLKFRPELVVEGFKTPPVFDHNYEELVGGS